MSGWEDSELALDAPEQARALWDAGYRPTEAQHLVAGDFVAFFDADLMGDGVGQHRTARVWRVGRDDLGVVVDHEGGTTDADDCLEVWCKKSSEEG